jgi:hypothetical protein
MTVPTSEPFDVLCARHRQRVPDRENLVHCGDRLSGLDAKSQGLTMLHLLLLFDVTIRVDSSCDNFNPHFPTFSIT